MSAEYIDREQLLEHLQYLNNELPLISEHDWGRALGYDEVIDEVKKYPAEDVQPVVHGKWVTETDGWMFCSECGNSAEVNGITGEFMESPYCSECGARMDGEDNA